MLCCCYKRCPAIFLRNIFFKSSHSAMLTGFFPPSVFPQLFQKGLSLPEFKRLYGTEKQCEVALEKVCGPDGFRCPRCFLMSRARAGVRPAAYVLPMPILWTPGHAHVRHDHAGHQVKLTTWFSAFYLICQAKTGISSLELSRHLGVNYDTAWMLHNKILRAMAEREKATCCGERFRWMIPT